MLLAIDCGNTNTLFAVHDGRRWRAQWRTATHTTRTADEYAVLLHQLFAERYEYFHLPPWLRGRGLTAMRGNS
jgi:pantothenate kinase type III